MKILFALIVGFGFFLSGCASILGPREPVEGKDFEFFISVNQAEQRFDLEIKSLSDRVMFVPYMVWPDGRGYLESATTDVYVLNEGHIYYYQNLHNFPFCAGGCEDIIKPGETLKGFVLFSEFPEEAFLDERAELKLRFIYEPHPYFE